ncbi:MAG TPA: serine/threonine-protein kinase [Ktedonobacteraceae bacterium]|nr:serine/threonine-protein kinase [Ktedonobacteraceae bacterium]
MQKLEGVTFSHYQIQSLLARGGMAQVYLARDNDSGQMVAIKVVHKSAGDYYERCRREVAAVALLKHNHILPALDCGEYESLYYLVTPYIEHGTLQDRLAQGPMTLEEAGKVLEQLANALQFSHDHGIIHRDIKASNILLRDPDYVYLADFGLVKNIADDYSITQSGYLIGTPEYMAPELVDLPATVSSDIYALGIVLYQMLTGRVPFTGNAPVAICLKHIRELPTPPSVLNPLIPQAIEEVMLCALEKDPQRRFQSAHDLLRAYQAAFESEMNAMTVRVAAVRPVGGLSVPPLRMPDAPVAEVSDFSDALTATELPNISDEATVLRTPALVEEEPTIPKSPALPRKNKLTLRVAIGLIVIVLLLILLCLLSIYSIYNQNSHIGQPGIPHASPTIIVKPGR